MSLACATEVTSKLTASNKLEKIIFIFFMFPPFLIYISSAFLIDAKALI